MREVILDHVVVVPGVLDALVVESVLEGELSGRGEDLGEVSEGLKDAS